MLIQTSCNDAPKSSNPLTEESKAPFGAPDFSLYKTSDYMPAFEQGIAEKRADIQKIINIIKLTTTSV